jgi:hypothetical protein
MKETGLPDLHHGIVVPAVIDQKNLLEALERNF